MTASEVVVIGAGGFGREVAQLVRDIRTSGIDLRVRGFLDDNPNASVPHGERLIGTTETFDEWDSCLVACAVGSPKSRQAIVERLRGRRVEWATLVHPRALVGARCSIAPGVIVCAGAIVTVDVTLEEHVHVNLACTIGHDVRIGAFSTLSPGCGISGAANIGQRVFLGTQAVVLPGVAVGDDSTVGAGSVVLRPVPSGITVVGVPARRL